MVDSKNSESAVGRRKSSVARVYLRPGDGNIIVNKQAYEKYFDRESHRRILRQPLIATEALGTYDIVINVKGGGQTGQVGAAQLGIARVLVKADESRKSVLRKGGFLTVDSRIVERKKPGLHKARKRPQYSKR